MNKSEQISRLFIKANLTASKQWPEYRPDADANWITTESGLPWLRLDAQVPVDLILQEIKQAEHLLVDHRDQYGEHQGWKSVCLHGKSLTDTQHCDDDRPFHWIPTMQKLMPNTVKFLKDWDIGIYQRVRIMALAPNGYVGLHRDLVRGQERNFLGPINIAITQPRDCHFVVKEWGEIPFRPGDAVMPDVNNWHAVFNNSNQTRYHIIVHSTKWTDSFKQTLERSYNQMFDKNSSISDWDNR